MTAERLALVVLGGLLLTAAGPPPLPPSVGPELPTPPPALPTPTATESRGTAQKQRGVALGLFAEDVSFSYKPLIEEIAALGATHIALVVPFYQQDGASTSLRLHTRLSPTLAATAEAARAARQAGLAVTLFPIVRLESPRGPNEWRGTLAPSNRPAWFRSYEALLGDLAAVGRVTEATRLVVGSELSTLDGEADLPLWRPVIEKVRALFSGTLVYSANWDHFREARLYDLVDEIGVVGYFNLREPSGPSDVEALAGRWRALRGELENWLVGRAKPFVITELGYRSRAGSSASPWDETPGGSIDLDEQRRSFAAFRRAWSDPGAPAVSLDGVYIWNWYGFGGPGSAGYTPRGKPALEEVRRLLREM
jgi:hypothetical protein